MRRTSAARGWLIPLVAALVAAGVYLPALGSGFVFDDHPQIELSQPRLAWSQLPGYFTGNVWSYVGQQTNYYRPVFLIWLLLNYRLFGLTPVLWHLSTLAVHAAATLLFYLLARRITGDDLLGGAAALLFAVHPVHVEAVAWISGVTDPLAAVFLFGAILCHLRWRESRSWWRLAAVLLCAAAVFEKETALVLPVLLYAYEWLFPKSAAPGRKRWLASFIAVIPYAAVAAAYLALRVLVLGGFSPIPVGWPPVVLVSTLPSVVVFYLVQLMRPFDYRLFYAISPVIRPEWGSLAGAGVIVCVLAWISWKSRAAAFSAMLLALPLVPVLDLAAFPHEDFVHDRYLYIPSAGLCLLIALGLRHAVARLGLRLSAGVLLAVVALLGSVAARETLYWRDDEALCRRAVELSPASVAARRTLGDTLIRQGRSAEALPLLLTALAHRLGQYRLRADDYVLYAQIGRCYLEAEELERAAGYLEDSLSLEPRYSHTHLYLGILRLKQKRLAEAESHLRQALALRPKGFFPAYYRRYHYFLGAVLESRGDLTGARAEYEAELRENPDASDVEGRVMSVRSRVEAR